MALGDYWVIKEESTGVELARWVLNADPGDRPHVGEEVTHGDSFYPVRRIEHILDPENRASRDKTMPVVYIRNGEGRRPGPMGGGAPSWKKPKAGSFRTARVLKFVPPDKTDLVRSWLFPPSFIVAIAWVAYSKQEFEYARAKSQSYVVRDGDGQWASVWIGDDPRGLSHNAGMQLLDLKAFIHDRLLGRDPVTVVDGCYVPHTLPPETLATMPTIQDGEESTANIRPPTEERRARLPQEAPIMIQAVAEDLSESAEGEGESEPPHLRLVRR